MLKARQGKARTVMMTGSKFDKLLRSTWWVMKIFVRLLLVTVAMSLGRVIRSCRLVCVPTNGPDAIWAQEESGQVGLV